MVGPVACDDVATGEAKTRQVEAMIVGPHCRKATCPTEVSEIIVSKTDGVPLFVEEMTKAILETDVLEDLGERYVLQGPIRCSCYSSHAP